MTEIKNGVYTDISIQDYHSNTSHLSATGIKIAKKSLKEWHWTRMGLIPREEKMAYSFGNAFELALIDPIGFSEQVAVLKDSEWIEATLKDNPDITSPRGTKVYKGLFTTFVNENKGKYMINETGKESYETIKHMMESAFADAVIQKLILNTEYQTSVFWTDEESGLNLKTRPDLMKSKKNIVVNIKTAEDGSPAAFSRDLAKYEYPLQACIEMRGVIESGIMPSVDTYFWLVFEKNPPYNATLYDFAESDRNACNDQLQYLLNKISRSMKEEKYPGYSDQADNQFGILTANIPLWYKILG